MSRSNKWSKENNEFRFDGESGVQNFSRFVRSLGYRDNQHFGQFRDGCYGDLIHFLEDNPGAVDAMIKWIDENYSEDECSECLEDPCACDA